MDVEKSTDGNRKSDLATAPAGTPDANSEFPVVGNEDNFIRGRYIYRDETGTDEYSFVEEPADSADNKNQFVGDSVLLNPNGLVNFELEIKDIKRNSPVRQVQSQQSENDRNNVVQVSPGGPFKSITVKVTNSRIKSGGNQSNIINNGLIGIYIDNPEASWKGPVTVDLSTASELEVHVSEQDGRFARGVQIGMKAGNNNIATVRLRDTSHIEIAGAGRILSRVAGRLNTTGVQSPGVFVQYARGGGSVRVNTPLEIRTNGEDSPGIRAELAQVVDPLQDRTKTDSWDGISLGNAIWSVYAAGVTAPDRLWGASTYSDSMGLTLAQMELFFRFGRTNGGCLD